MNAVQASALVLAPFLATCGGVHRNPLHVSPQEVAEIDEGEGIVVGSFSIHVEPEGADASLLQRLRSAKTMDASYSVEIVEYHETNFFGREEVYVAHPRADEESTFVARLPAGHYFLGDVVVSEDRAVLLGACDFRANVRGDFQVIAGQTIYIGRLVFELPARVGEGAPCTLHVEDAQESTLANLPGDYTLGKITPALLTDVQGGTFREPPPPDVEPPPAPR
jgi:hypothetical protein